MLGDNALHFTDHLDVGCERGLGTAQLGLEGTEGWGC